MLHSRYILFYFFSFFSFFFSAIPRADLDCIIGCKGYDVTTRQLLPTTSIHVFCSSSKPFADWSVMLLGSFVLGCTIVRSRGGALVHRKIGMRLYDHGLGGDWSVQVLRCCGYLHPQDS